MFLRVPFTANESKELFNSIYNRDIDSFPENHPYSDQLINMLLWTFIVDSKERPSAKDMLDSTDMKEMREFLMNDTEYIQNYKETKIKAPIFMPQDKTKLNRRIMAKFDDSYKFTPKKAMNPIGWCT